jgi:hypothetical protein
MEGLACIERELAMALPQFTPDGLLPAGDHLLTIGELRRSYLVTGEGIDVPGWDSALRAQLVDHLELFVRQLWQVGVERIFVNGSFVTSKPQPGDIDAYFECTLTDYPLTLIRLMLLEPSLPWDLAHRPIDPGSQEPKPVMWHRYRVEVFPHFTDYPNLTGIFDEDGNEFELADLFRRDKNSLRLKGVIQIVR